jgi:ATP-dependent DNA ligase
MTVALMRPTTAVVVPREDGMRGGVRYEVKVDGWRARADILATGAVLRSRKGTDLSTRFPELIDGLSRLPQGVVLDGEVVAAAADGHLDFLALQRTRQTRAAAGFTVLYVVFDLLAVPGGTDIRRQPLHERVTRLESVLNDLPPGSRVQQMAATTSRDLALQWYASMPTGMEGLVCKSLASRYDPKDTRAWVKIRRRQSTEAIIGAITGTLPRPQLLILGRYDTEGRLRMVGQSTPLEPNAARQLAGHLTKAGPDHPWSGVHFTASWHTREPLNPTLTVPELVAEISADTAIDQGIWRHPLHYLRLREDVTAADVPPFAS